MNIQKAPSLIVCLPIETVDGTPVSKQRELINSLAAQAHSGAMDDMGILFTSPIHCEDSNERFNYMFNERYIGHTTILDNGPYYAPRHQRYIEIMYFLRSRNWPNAEWIAFDTEANQYPEKYQDRVHEPTGENIQAQIESYHSQSNSFNSSSVA